MLALAAAVTLACGGAAAAAATLNVNTTLDELTPEDGRCSLREAIAAVNSPATGGDCGSAAVGTNTIVLGPGRYLLSIPPVGPDDNASGDLNPASSVGSLAITGAGVASSVIDARGLGDRVFDITAGAGITISGLTITGAHAPEGKPGANGELREPGGAGGAGGNGGAIRNSGSLALSSVAVAGNSAGDGGSGGEGGEGEPGEPGGEGGAGGRGGAIYNAGTGTLTLTAVTISGNRAGDGGPGGTAGPASGPGGAGGVGGDGGGVSNDGGLTVAASTFTANSAGLGGVGGKGDGSLLASAGNGGVGGAGATGGAISTGVSGSMSLTNSTIAGNSAGGGGEGGNAGPGSGGGIAVGHGGNGGNGGNGGGIYVASIGKLSALSSTTVAGNGSGSSGGGGKEAGKGGSVNGNPGSAGVGGGVSGPTKLTLEDTIVAASSGGNCAGSVTDGGHNLSFGDASCPGSFASGDPKLGPLRDNGGPTETIGLGAGSAAIDQIPLTGAGCPATDQRGVARPFGPMCDIGAYEVTPPVVSTGGSSAVGASGATINATVTANAVDASVHFEFGASTSYGQQTPAQHVRGVFPVAVESGLSGLSPNTTYHYRVVASSTDGTAVSADQTFTTAPAPPGASPPGASPLAAIAKLTGLGESYSIFAVAASPTPLNGQAAVRGHHKGTVFSFALDRAASVKIAIQTTTAGRRVRRACRPASPRLSRKPRCTRTVTIATLTRAGHTGLNKVAFSGRISGKALKPGRYQALFSAIDAAGASAPHSLSFTIVKR